MSGLPRYRAGIAGGRRGARVIRPGRGSAGSSRADQRGRRSWQRVGAGGVGVVAGLPVTTPDVHALPGWLRGGGKATQLRLVWAGRRIRLGPGAFAAAVIGALTAILVGLLILNTALTTDSFQLQGIRIKDRELVVAEQELLGKLADAQSPVGLQQKARELGMVPAANPVFLRLSDTKVLGESDPASAPPAPEKPNRKPRDPVTDPAGAAGVGGIGGESPAELVVSSSALAAGPVIPMTVGQQPGVAPHQVAAPGGMGGETGVGLVGLSP